MKIILAIAMILVSGVVFAAKTVGYDAPTEYTDGAPLALSDIKEYRILGANVSGGPYDQFTMTVPGDSTTATLQVAGGVDWFFVMRTVLHNGLESDYSNEVSRSAAKPNAPIITYILDFTATLSVQTQ